MRITIDCRCVFSGCGGIGTYARSLVRAMAAVNDYDEFVVLRTAHRPTDPLTESPNFHEIAVSAAMLDADWEQLQLPSLLEDLDADLYHNPVFALPVVAPCATVATIHDVVFHYRPDLVSLSLCGYLRRWSEIAAHISRRVLTVSAFSREAIHQAYRIPLDKIDVTYEAADLARFQPRYGGAVEQEFRRRYGIAGRFVLYVGSLEPKKNIDGLLAAFSTARGTGASAYKLVLAGGGGGMAYDAAEAIAAHGLAGDVVVTGFLPDAYLPIAYNAAEVFVYPSLYEGFGLPPLEAMACGTPTIVSRTTSLPEVVGEAAYLVDPDDVEDMAAALARVACDEDLRADLRARGLAQVRQFSWQQTALDTLACYHRAAA